MAELPKRAVEEITGGLKRFQTDSHISSGGAFSSQALVAHQVLSIALPSHHSVNPTPKIQSRPPARPAVGL